MANQEDEVFTVWFNGEIFIKEIHGDRFEAKDFVDEKYPQGFWINPIIKELSDKNMVVVRYGRRG